MPPLPHDDTIVAIITPPGEGGVAAIRLAGRQSLSYLNEHFQPISKKGSLLPFLMQYGHFYRNDNDAPLDEVMAVYMPEGRSYTGLEQVEIYCHGGSQVVRMILDELLASGARAAEPGEFTRIAFLSGRIDLAHAEAVAEIIAANTESSYEAARDHLIGSYSTEINELRAGIVAILAEVESGIDFPEEEINPDERTTMLASLDDITIRIKELADSYKGGRIIREGFRVAIAGRPNAGKSSLFNLLLRQQRALVTPTAGTTRDYLSEWIDLGGYAVNIVDTAGLRKKGGTIERAGQQTARDIIKKSDLILWMVDIGARSFKKQLHEDMATLDMKKTIVIGNKIDSVDDYKSKLDALPDVATLIPISCTTRKGLTALKKSITGIIAKSMPDLTSGSIVTSARHQQALVLSGREIRSARKLLADTTDLELVAFDLKAATSALDEITGRIYTEEILGHIFSKFCVGK